MTFDTDSYDDDEDEIILIPQAKRLSTRIDAIILQYIEEYGNDHTPHVILSAIASVLIKLVALTGDRNFLFDTLQDMVPENEVLQKLDVDLNIPISIKRH